MTLHQVGSGRSPRCATNRCWTFAPVTAVQTRQVQQAGDTLAGAPHAAVPQFGPDAWRTVGAATLLMRLPDVTRELLVRTGASGGRATPPGVVPAPRDTQYPAEGRH